MRVISPCKATVGNKRGVSTLMFYPVDKILPDFSLLLQELQMKCNQELEVREALWAGGGIEGPDELKFI